MSGRILRLYDIFVLSHQFVIKIVIHLFLWGKVWAELWAFARNDKQNVGRKQGSVEIGVEVSNSYSNKTYSSVWVLSSSPDLMRMPYSVELTIGFFFIHDSASLATARYWWTRYNELSSRVCTHPTFTREATSSMSHRYFTLGKSSLYHIKWLIAIFIVPSTRWMKYNKVKNIVK